MNIMGYLKGLQGSDFAMLGLHDVAYILPVTKEGKRQFAIHAADGTQLAVVDKFDEAIATVRWNDMKPVRVH